MTWRISKDCADMCAGQKGLPENELVDFVFNVFFR